MSFLFSSKVGLASASWAQHLSVNKKRLGEQAALSSRGRKGGFSFLLTLSIISEMNEHVDSLFRIKYKRRPTKY